MKPLFPTARLLLAGAVAVAGLSTGCSQLVAREDSPSHPPQPPDEAALPPPPRGEAGSPQPRPDARAAREDGADAPSSPDHPPRHKRGQAEPTHPWPEHPSGGRGSSRGSGGHGELTGDLLVIDRLLAMHPEHLARIREAIERIENMSDEERAAMRERLREFRKFSPEQRQRMRDKWREMSPEERREHIRELRERRWERFFGEGEPEKAPPHLSPDQ